MTEYAYSKKLLRISSATSISTMRSSKGGDGGAARRDTDGILSQPPACAAHGRASEALGSGSLHGRGAGAGAHERRAHPAHGTVGWMNDDEAAGTYPAHWEADVVLRDGRTCRIRPIQQDDGPALTDFHKRLSSDTLYLRFFTASEDLAARDVERLMTIDYRVRVGLLALRGDEVVGVGAYDGVDHAEAEIAFTISDNHQGRGDRAGDGRFHRRRRLHPAG